MIAAVRAADRFRDVALAAGLAALGYVELFSHATYEGKPVWPGSAWASGVFIAAFTAPLIWRRRRPLASFLVLVVVLAVGTSALGGGQTTAGFLAGLVAVFSASLYAERPALVAVVAVGLVCVLDLNVAENRNLNSVVWGVGVLGVAWLLGRAVHGRQRTIGVLTRDAVERQRRHADAVAAATAAERASIARELHDIVAHAVSVIVIQSQAGARALPGRPEVAAQVLATIEHSGRSALGELRRLLTLLSEEAPTGVTPAPSLRHLDDLVRDCQGAGLSVQVDRQGSFPALEPAADVAAFRFLQEALTNVLRHAPGASARLTIDSLGPGVRLVVQDDGGKRPVERLDLGTGRGLIGMRERMSLCGGQLVTAGPAGPGFRIEAWLPVDETAEAERSPSVMPARA